MKVIKATDYGYRKVVRVLINDPEPAVSHLDGSPHVKPIPTEIGDLVSERSLAVIMEGYQPAVKAVIAVTGVAAVEGVDAVEATDTTPAVESVRAVQAVQAVTGVPAQPEVKTQKQLSYEALLQDWIQREADPEEWCNLCTNNRVVQHFQFDGNPNQEGIRTNFPADALPVNDPGLMFKQVEVEPAVMGIPAVEAVEATDDSPAVEAVEGVRAVNAVYETQYKSDKEIIADAIERAAAITVTVREMEIA